MIAILKYIKHRDVAKHLGILWIGWLSSGDGDTKRSVAGQRTTPEIPTHTLLSFIEK